MQNYSCLWWYNLVHSQRSSGSEALTEDRLSTPFKINTDLYFLLLELWHPGVAGQKVASPIPRLLFLLVPGWKNGSWVWMILLACYASCRAAWVVQRVDFGETQICTLAVTCPGLALTWARRRWPPNSGVWKQRRVPWFGHLALNRCCGAVLAVPVQVKKSQVHDEDGRRVQNVKISQTFVVIFRNRNIIG